MDMCLIRGLMLWHCGIIVLCQNQMSAGQIPSVLAIIKSVFVVLIYLKDDSKVSSKRLT